MENELHKLFVEELQDMLHAEQQLSKALPKLAAAAQSEELREAFESHLIETENHLARLEEVFANIGAVPKAKKCPAMEGIIKEGRETLEEHEGNAAMDAALIAAAQKAEHYEIASYGCLCTWAKYLGYDEALATLKETLAEEKATDEKLTLIATSWANATAEAAH